MHLIVVIEVILYVLLMVGVGAYFSKKNKSQEDFLLGGRKIPAWALAISERATTSSSWIMIGATGLVYTIGYSGIWLFVGNFLALIVLWFWFAKIYRSESVKYETLTISDYLTTKWGSDAKAIRILGVLIVTIFYFFYAGSQFAGAAKTIYALFGIEQIYGMIFIAIVVIVYASLGGFASVVWTDVIQGFIMIFTLLILPIIAFIKIKSNGVDLAPLLASQGSTYTSFTGGLTGFTAALLIFNQSSWFFGYYGQPAVVRKYMALSSEEDIIKGRRVGIIWGLLMYIGVFAIGITGLGLYGPGAFADPELLFPTMVSDLLPIWLGGICLCAVIAAILSTTADQLLAITGAVTVDLIKKGMKIDLTQKQLVTVSRITLAIAGLCGFIVALFSKALVFKMVSFAWTGMGSTLTPAMLITLFMKKCTGKGVVATLVTGLILTFTWSYIPVISVISGRAGAFFISLAAGIIVSLVTYKESNDIKKSEAN
jgi:sodium/proline symporter